MRWSTIPHFPNYATSRDGAVMGPSGNILKSHTAKTGYCFVSICHDGRIITASVHRLVATTFIPNPLNKPQVNHKNGIKTDNRVENLEWNTISENQKHSIRTGLRTAKGVKNSQAQLDELSVRVIREAVAANCKKSDIARYFKVSPATITDIYTRRSWPHI